MLNVLIPVFISLMILGQQTGCAPTAPYIQYSTPEPAPSPPTDDESTEEEPSSPSSTEEEGEEGENNDDSGDDKGEGDKKTDKNDVPEGVEFYSRQTPEAGPDPLTRGLY